MPGESVLRARCRKLGVQLFGPDHMGPEVVVEESRGARDFETLLSSWDEGDQYA